MSFGDFDLLVNTVFSVGSLKKNILINLTLQTRFRIDIALCVRIIMIRNIPLSFSLSLSLSLSRFVCVCVCVCVYYFNSIYTSNDELINQEHPHSIQGPISKRRCPGYSLTKPRIQWSKGNQIATWTNLDMELSFCSPPNISLSFISFSRSSGLHPVSAQGCCMLVKLDVLSLLVHVKGSTGVYHSRVPPCSYISVPRVWFV